MNILIIGAGVLGSLYSAKLMAAGNQVTVLARGKKFQEIRDAGIILSGENGLEPPVHPRVIDQLDPEEPFDLAMVLVRNNQLDELLPIFQEYSGIQQFLFMVNNCAGSDRLVAAAGIDRTLLGFPGAGGEKIGNVVHYRVVSSIIQPTTIGELDGRKSLRIRQIAQTIRSAGFPVSISTNMDAWLKTHVAVVSPIANAIYMANGSNYELSRNPAGVRIMVKAVKEGFTVLKALDIPTTPSKYRFLLWIPESLLVEVLRLFLNTREAELIITRHANHARDEMAELAADFMQLVQRSKISTPEILRLNTYNP